jgi:hypothetical protein
MEYYKPAWRRGDDYEAEGNQGKRRRETTGK